MKGRGTQNILKNIKNYTKGENIIFWE